MIEATYCKRGHEFTEENTYRKPGTGWRRCKACRSQDPSRQKRNRARPVSFDPRSVARFWSKVDKTVTCWLWTAGKTSKGYGKFTSGDTTIRAHRYAYEVVVGPIPEGLVLDHLCRVPACVNPSHLEPVTSPENSLRGFSPMAVNARKKRCIRGHEFSGDNLYISPRGERICRACTRLRTSRSEAKP